MFPFQNAKIQNIRFSYKFMSLTDFLPIPATVIFMFYNIFLYFFISASFFNT